MNNISKLSLSTALVFTLISCGMGGKKDDSTTVTNANAAVAAAAADNAVKNSMDDANAKIKERRAKGDTLAMPYTDLQKYLPQSVDGYTADPPTGASMNMMKMSYSSAVVRFKKDNGDWVRVTIVDYNQASSLYNSATAMWSMGLTVDSPEEKANGIKVDNTNGGWQVYKKKTKNAIVTVGVGYRFWVQAEANNQDDADKVLSIVKSVDLAKLASL